MALKNHTSDSPSSTGELVLSQDFGTFKLGVEQVCLNKLPDVEEFQRTAEPRGNPRDPGPREREAAIKKFYAFVSEATNAISFKAKRGLIEGTLPAERIR